ncbi:MFS transporter [Arthrobacter rhombi]|uniref:MFS transporter n=1 Tax=Arthrobacter rhombi TaxID=71253 RepID=UPI003FD1C263
MNTSSPQRKIRPLLLSNAADAGGNQTFGVTLNIVTVTILGFSATQVGLLNALGSLSFLLLSVPLGMLVDRVGAARVLAISLSIKLLGATSVLTLFLSGNLNDFAAMFAVTVAGILTVASENAQTTIVPQLTEDQGKIANVIAKMASVDMAAGIIFPGLTGLIIATWGVGPALAMSTAMFTLAAVAFVPPLRRALLGPTRDRHPEKSQKITTSAKAFIASATHGFSTLIGNRVLLGITLLTAAGNIGLAIGSSIEPILILRSLNLGVQFFGILGTVAAASGLAATFVAPKVAKMLPLRQLFGWGAVAQAVVATLPLAAYVWPPAAIPFLIGFHVLWAVTLTVTNIAGAAYTASAVSSTSLGRTSAAQRTITMGSIPLAALGGGLLADVFGVIAPLTVWPAVTIGAAGLFFLVTTHSAKSEILS